MAKIHRNDAPLYQGQPANPYSTTTLPEIPAQKPAAEFYDQDHDEEFTEREEKKHPKKHAQKNAEARKKKRGDLVYTIAMVVFAVIFLVSGGLWLGRLAHKKPLLAMLVLLDLAVLGGFKYAGFAAESINAVVPGLLPVLSPALPLGISFYVFTAIGYCVDVAAGRAEPEKSPFKFAVFLAFFGHGPSGPIVRYNQQAPQLDPRSEARKVDLDRFSYGIKRLILGLAKKAIIADQLALIYAKVASVPAATLPAPILILGYTAYMMQLYFDFSGYSDMAIGIGEFFGITLPENFDYP